MMRSLPASVRLAGPVVLLLVTPWPGFRRRRNSPRMTRRGAVSPVKHWPVKLTHELPGVGLKGFSPGSESQKWGSWTGFVA